MGSYTNDPEMFGQGQDHPIAKMTVNRDQRSLFPHGPVQNQRIVRPFLANLGGTNNIMARLKQQRGQIHPQHLIQVQAHSAHTPSAEISVCKMECRAYSKAAWISSRVSSG